MPLDPQFRAVLDQLDALGAIPLIRGSADDTKAHYKAISMARRSEGYTPEAVADVRDNTVDGPGGPIPVRVYTPVTDRGRLVTYAHGGGWVVGDLDTHDPVCRRVANALGAVVVSVDYRLAPEHPHPAPLDDFVAGIDWAATTYPDRPHAIAGDSAGASLSAGAAIRVRDKGGPKLAAQVLIYPSTDTSMSQPSIDENADGYFLTKSDMQWFYDQYVPDKSARTDSVLDVLHAPDLSGLAPAVIATAEFDPLRDDGAAYAKKLEAAGVPVTYLPGPGLIHGYFSFLGVVDKADERSKQVLEATDTLLG